MKSRLISGQPIQGAELRNLEMHRDPRGCFTEVFQQSWNTVIDPCQWSVVSSTSRVFRGCHLHLRHDECFCLMQGEATLGLRDLRADSPTNGNWQMYRLHGDDIAVLTFPAGVVHGWYLHQPSLHLQAVSESYAEYGDDDNLGVHWGDPDMEIPWDFKDPILSERAAGFGSLKELEARISNLALDQ